MLTCIYFNILLHTCAHAHFGTHASTHLPDACPRRRIVPDAGSHQTQAHAMRQAHMPCARHTCHAPGTHAMRQAHMPCARHTCHAPGTTHAMRQAPHMPCARHTCHAPGTHAMRQAHMPCARHTCHAPGTHAMRQAHMPCTRHTCHAPGTMCSCDNNDTKVKLTKSVYKMKRRKIQKSQVNYYSISWLIKMANDVMQPLYVV